LQIIDASYILLGRIDWSVFMEERIPNVGARPIRLRLTTGSGDLQRRAASTAAVHICS
jgi:hypothetical protein